ncbi:MAG: HypC/HybG/HupF family hydrogenase formation chaperone [bacterium]
MCLANMGKIKKIKKNNIAEVNFDGVSLDVNIELVDAKLGDFIMVHAGFAIQKVDENDLKELNKLYGTVS